MFVHPEQVHAVTQRHPAVRRARLVVTQHEHLDVMTLHAEVGDQHDSSLAANLAATLREVCKLRGEVVLCAPGSLPADGKVIDDARSLA